MNSKDIYLITMVLNLTAKSLMYWILKIHKNPDVHFVHFVY